MLKMLHGIKIQNTLVGLAGVLLTMLLAFASWQYEREKYQILLDGALDERARSISNELSTDLQILKFLALHYSNNADIDRKNFLMTAQDLESEQPAIRSLMWAPRVTHEQRQNYVSELRVAFPDFEIHETAPEGGTRSANNRPDYLPYEIVHAPRSLQRMGFDLQSLPHLQSAIEKAKRTGKLQLSELFSWPLSKQAGHGILALTPIYSGQPSTNQAREAAFRGVIVAAIDIGSLITSATEALPRNNLNYTIVAKLPNNQKVLLAEQYSPYTSYGITTLETHVTVANDFVSGWTAHATPGRDLDVRSMYATPLFVALVGLILTLVTLRVKAMRDGREEKIQRLVEVRTEELNDAKNQLQQESLTDPLTGLSNRRCMDQVLASEWLRAMRDKSEVTLMLIDIDHFKRYNDLYGHVEGDKALRAVANIINASFRRPGDTVARFGGEEFIVFLPNTNGAELYAARLVKAVQRINIPHGDSPTAAQLTISVGFLQCRPSDGTTVDDAVETADAALYEAKHAGRNQVFIAGSELGQQPLQEPVVRELPPQEMPLRAAVG